MSRALKRCYNVARLRERAKKRMPAAMFHYIDGAAGDEWTMRQNTFHSEAASIRAASISSSGMVSMY